MQQKLQLPIYLDNNATTPVDPGVLQAMLPYFTQHFGNAASRNHSFGWIAEEAVIIAREQIASLLGATAEEVIFTSGATEAVNLAIKGVYETYSSKGKHIITCVTEHKAVLDTCRHLERSGASVTYLPVDRHGIIDLNALEQSIQKDTILIAVMFANNETGVIQPVETIGRIAKEKAVLFFSDATQAVGKIPMNVEKNGIDLLCLSAHKIYGPKGAGALYVRRKDPRVRLTAQIDGGGHEKGMRSGTLNVPGIVALGKACALCEQRMDEETIRLSMLRNKLEAGLTAIEEVNINGGNVLRLPNVTNLSFSGIKSNRLLTEISKTIAVSSGSACTSANPEASHVLKAMDVRDTLARNSIRFGLGRFTTEEEIAYTISTVTQIVASLRK
ncbi:MAG: IscS subfamily cysteine desulfurase [Sphingobacteriales bacterium]|nr:IscS subfamily cysteine desulfurase [Sphingobacteriales bacterium]OJY84386.1 MAG: IscS subfamily cysteine desulfurase [Sphingobacteriales bacterium 44-15]